MRPRLRKWACCLHGIRDGPELFPLGFNINFYGTEYSGAYINNNGNITFDSLLSDYTPFDLDGAGIPIIAPFFADVDTRVGNNVEIGTGQLTVTMSLWSIGRVSAATTRTTR